MLCKSIISTLGAISSEAALSVRCLSTLLVSLGLSLGTPAVCALDETEQAISASVDKHLAYHLDLLERAVNINSGTMNTDGVVEAGAVFAEAFEAIGFDTRWVDGVDFQRGGHLVASHGSKGPKILFIGHIDTVFAKDSPFQTFQRIDENYAAGPGVTDMKGGNVVMLSALRAMHDAGVLDDVQVRVVLTGDEEARGNPLDLSNEVLLAAGDWADIALGFEDGDSDPTTGVTARRSSSVWELQVTGKPAHSSQIFRDDIGFGAALELSRILDRWREELSAIPNLTFNPGLIMAGTDLTHDADNTRGTAFGKSNVIARSAIATGGLRAISPEQIELAEKLMREIVADSLAQTSATLTMRHGYPPMAPTPQNNQLRQAFSDVSEELGYGPVVNVDPRKAGAADISFVASRVTAAMDGLGLLGEGGHTVDEVGDLRTLPQNAKRVAVLMYRLSTGAVVIE